MPSKVHNPQYEMGVTKVVGQQMLIELADVVRETVAAGTWPVSPIARRDQIVNAL